MLKVCLCPICSVSEGRFVSLFVKVSLVLILFFFSKFDFEPFFSESQFGYDPLFSVKVRLVLVLSFAESEFDSDPLFSESQFGSDPLFSKNQLVCG